MPDLYSRPGVRRDEFERIIKNALYDARNSGRTMDQAAEAAASAVVALDPPRVTMGYETVAEIVEYLLSLGTRDGLILGNQLNMHLGASARRFIEDPSGPAYRAGVPL